MESSNLPDIWRVNLNPRNVSKDNYDPSKEVFNWEFVGFMPYEVFFHSSAYDENRFWFQISRRGGWVMWGCEALIVWPFGPIVIWIHWYHQYGMGHFIWTIWYGSLQAIWIQPLKWKNICIWRKRHGRRSYRTHKSLFCSR